MDNPQKEKRQHPRFDAEAKIYFQAVYNIRTIVKYEVLNEVRPKSAPPPLRHLAISKNVSAGGLCFTSGEKLEQGNRLCLEVYVPHPHLSSSNQSGKEEICIPMEGEVRWSWASTTNKRGKKRYDTGVRLITVNGKSVAESIYFDEANKVFWSIVLESIFGSFRIFAQKNR